MAGKRGRPKGFKMPEEHRGKIRTTAILNRLQKYVLGEIPAESMTPHAVTAALGVLRKAMPDLSAQELTVDQAQPFAVLPGEIADTEAWESTFKPKTEH